MCVWGGGGVTAVHTCTSTRARICVRGIYVHIYTDTHGYIHRHSAGLLPWREGGGRVGRNPAPPPTGQRSRRGPHTPRRAPRARGRPPRQLANSPAGTACPACPPGPHVRPPTGELPCPLPLPGAPRAAVPLFPLPRPVPPPAAPCSFPPAPGPLPFGPVPPASPPRTRAMRPAVHGGSSTPLDPDAVPSPSVAHGARSFCLPAWNPRPQGWLQGPPCARTRPPETTPPGQCPLHSTPVSC